jgi:hypothetical protein
MATVSGYTGVRRSLVERAMAAARLDASAFEEVEADETATSQAATIVMIAALASGIGHISGGVVQAVISVIAALIGWILWSVITYFIGVTLFKGTATVGELLRTLGFAQAPGVLYVLAIIPILGALVSFAVAVWILIAGIIAIRQALDISTGKAVITAIIGWLVLLIPMMLIGGLAALVS